MMNFILTDNNYDTSNPPVFGSLLTGNTTVNNSKTINGIGTNFMGSLMIGDAIFLTGLSTVAHVVSINSNTQINVDIPIGDGTSRVINMTWDKIIQLNGLATTSIAWRKAPIGWNKMSYAFSRNQKYYGVFPTFTAPLGFTNGRSKRNTFPKNPNDGAKSWIDNILYTYGINTEIGVTVSDYNSQYHQFTSFISGVGNAESITIGQFHTNMEIISTLFTQDVINKDAALFDIQSMVDSYSINHANEVEWQFPALTGIELFGKFNTKHTDPSIPSALITGFTPFQIFERLIRLMTGVENAFVSSFFGKTGDLDENGVNYPVDGKGAYQILTSGRFIRGYTYSNWKVATGLINVIYGSTSITGTNFLVDGIVSGDILKDTLGNIIGTVSTATITDTALTINEPANENYYGSYVFQNTTDNATMILSFFDLFQAFSSIFCLGMSIITNDSGKEFISIEPLSTLYDKNVVSIIQDPKDLQIMLSDKWRHNEIEIGYQKYQKNPINIYGNTEFNNKSTYIIPSKFTKKKLSIISKLRTDSTGIQLCIDNLKGVDEDQQTEYDNEIFIISCFKDISDSNKIKSRNATNDPDFQIYVVTGSIYGETTEGANQYFNIEHSPSRMVQAWGAWIRTNIDAYPTKVISIHQMEELSKLSTFINGVDSGNYISDGVDIPIANLANPLLSGFKCSFNSEFTIDQILAFKQNPFGLIQVWDYISNVYRYIWVDEVSQDPIDKKANWTGELISDKYIQPIALEEYLTYLSGELIGTMDDTGVLLTLSQN